MDKHCIDINNSSVIALAEQLSLPRITVAAMIKVWQEERNDLETFPTLEQLQSGELKGKTIFYYKELGEPSHATALDYLINKYNWSNKEEKKEKKVKVEVKVIATANDIINPLDEIEDTRKKLNFTQAELNHLLNISSISLSKILTKYPNLELKNLKNTLVNLISKSKDNRIKKEIESLGNINETEINARPENVLVDKFLAELVKDSSLLWNRIRLNYQKKFKIDLSDALDIEANTENIIDKNWDSVVGDVSAAKNIDIKVKRLINSLQKRIINEIPLTKEELLNGNLSNLNIDTLSGFSESLEFDKISGFLFRSFEDVHTNQDVLDKVFEISTFEPAFQELYTILSKNKNLLQAFNVNIHKRVIESLIIITNKGLNAKTDLETKNVLFRYRVSNNWRANIKDNLIKQYYTEDTIKDIYDSIKSLREKNALNTIQVNDIIDTFNLLKITINPELIRNLIIKNYDNKQKFITNDIIGRLNLITNSIKQSQEETNKSIKQLINLEATDKKNPKIKEIKRKIKIGNFNAYGDLLTLAKKLEEVNIYETEITYTNVKSNQRFGASFHNHLTNWFSNKTNKEEFLNTLKEYLQVPAFKYSNILTNETSGLLKKLPNGEYELNEDNLKNLQYNEYGGIKDTYKKIGLEYNNFVKSDFGIIQLLFYLNSSLKTPKNIKAVQFFLPVPSDSANTALIATNKISLTNEDFVKLLNNEDTEKLSKIPLFKAVHNTVLQEVEEMQTAFDIMFEFDEKGNLKEKSNLPNLQKNYHYILEKGKPVYIKNGKPTGNVFKFQNFVIDTKAGKKYIHEILPKDLINKGYILKEDIINSFTEQPTFLGLMLMELTEVWIEQQITANIAYYSEYKDLFKNLYEGEFKIVVAEYALNNYLFQVDFKNLFGGNIKEFKNLKEPIKRGKRVFSGGREYAVDDVNEDFLSFIVDDIQIKTINFEALKQIISNTSDGISLITVEERLRRLSKEGKIEEYENLQKALASGNVEDLKNFVFSQQKNFLSAYKYNKNLGKFVTHQVKNSDVTLIKEVFKDTQLGEVIEFLEKLELKYGKGVQLNFESAVKEGNTGQVKIHDEQGNLVLTQIEQDLIEKNLTSSRYVDLKKVQDTETDIVNETNNLGTQLNKVILTNLDTKPSYKILGKKKTGEEVTKEIFDALGSLIERESKSVLKELKDDKGKITEASITARTLENGEEMLWNNNILDGLRINEKVNKSIQPIYYNNNQDKIFSNLTSLWTNNVTKLKFPGFHAYQMPNVFMGNKKTESLEQKDLDINTEIDWVDKKKANKKLNTVVLTKDKILKVEVLISRYDERFFNKPINDINSIDPKALIMLGYRIPTEAKYSLLQIEVVGFLPESMKGTIVVPDEWTTISGSDFDIDSLYTMTYNIDEDLRVIPFVEEEEEEPKKFKANSLESLGQIKKQFKNKFETNSKEAIQNYLLDCYISILENPYTWNEIMETSNFADITSAVDKVNTLNILHPHQNLDLLELNNKVMTGAVLKGLAVARLNLVNISNVAKIVNNSGNFVQRKLSEKQIQELGEDKIKKLYGEDFSDNVVTFKEFGFLSKGENRNLKGNYITSTSAQVVANILDIVANDMSSNMNDITLSLYMLHPMFGDFDYDYITFLIEQPIIIEYVNKELNKKGVFSTNQKNSYYSLRKEYLGKLLVNQVAQKKLTEQEVKDFIKERKGEKIDDLKIEILEINYNKLFTSEELLPMVNFNKTSLEEQEEFLRNQLILLNIFKTYQDIDFKIDTLQKALSADKVGAGPTLNTTIKLLNSIEKAGKNDFGYTINGLNAAQAIYPKFFKIKDYESYYKHLEDKLIHSNLSSYNILKDYSLEETEAFQDLVKTLKTEAHKNKLRRYYKTSLISELPFFENIDKDIVLGTNNNIIEEVLDIKEFNEIIFNRYLIESAGKQLELVKNQLNFDNMLLNSLFLQKEVETDYDKIGILYYSNNDELVDSFRDILKHPNLYIKELGYSLIKYAYLTEGLNYGNNIGSLIPIEYLSYNSSYRGQSLNVASHLRGLMRLNQETEYKGYALLHPHFLDIFYLQEWKDNTLVPLVENTTKTNVNGDLIYDTNYPRWKEENGMIKVTEIQLNNTETLIKNAPFVKLKVGEDFKIYKRYKVEEKKFYLYSPIQRKSKTDFSSDNIPNIKLDELDSSFNDSDAYITNVRKYIIDKLVDIETTVYKVSRIEGNHLIEAILKKNIEKFTDYELDMTYKRIKRYDEELQYKEDLNIKDSFKNLDRDDKERVITYLIAKYEKAAKEGRLLLDSTLNIPIKTINEYNEVELLKVLGEISKFDIDTIDFLTGHLNGWKDKINQNLIKDINNRAKLSELLLMGDVFVKSFRDLSKLKLKLEENDIALNKTAVLINTLLLEMEELLPVVNNLQKDFDNLWFDFQANLIKSESTNLLFADLTIEEIKKDLKENMLNMEDVSVFQRYLDSASKTTNVVMGNNFVSARKIHYKSKLISNKLIAEFTEVANAFFEAGNKIEDILVKDINGEVTTQFSQKEAKTKEQKDLVNWLNKNLKTILNPAIKNTIIHKNFLPAVPLAVDATWQSNLSKFFAYYDDLSNVNEITDKDGKPIKGVNMPFISKLVHRKEIAIPDKFIYTLEQNGFEGEEKSEDYVARVLKEIYYIYGYGFKNFKEIADYNEKVRKSNALLRSTNPEKNVNLDILTTIPMFIRKATEFVAKSQVKNELLLLQSKLNREDLSRIQLRPSRVNKIISRYSGKETFNSKPAKGSNLEKQVEWFVDNLIYEHTNKSGATATKWARVLQNYTSIKSLGFNPFAAVNNISYGSIMNRIAAASRDGFTSKDLNAAIYTHYLPNIQSFLADSGDKLFKPTSLESGILSYFDILRKQSEEVTRKDENWVDKTKGTFYIFSNAGEHLMQNSVLLAMVLGSRVVDGKIINYNTYLKTKLKIKEKRDTIEILKEKEIFNKEFLKTAKETYDNLDKLMNHFTFEDGNFDIKDISLDELAIFGGITVTNKIQEIHGEYNEEDRKEFESLWYGRLAMLFRKWARPGWNKNWGSKFFRDNGYSEFKKDNDKGDFASFFDFTAIPFKDWANNEERTESLTFLAATKLLWDYRKFAANSLTYYHTLDIQERNRVKRGSLKLLTLFALVALFKTMKLVGDDDDDFTDNKAWGFTLLTIDRLKTELGTYLPPIPFVTGGWANEGKKLWTSPAASSNTLIDIFDLGRTVFEMPFKDNKETTYQSGIYYGQNKAKVQAIKLTPLLNQYWRWKYIQKQNKAFKLYQ